MLGTRQKQCLTEGLTRSPGGLARSIRMIRLKKISNPDEIQLIVDSALAIRRDKTISDYKDIGTTAGELLSFLHEAFPDMEGHK